MSGYARLTIFDASDGSDGRLAEARKKGKGFIFQVSLYCELPDLGHFRQGPNDEPLA
jgi:hypothetical protein